MRFVPRRNSFRKTDNDKLVMLGETEEYEPLSRAAYYHAMRDADKNKILSPTFHSPKERELVPKNIVRINNENPFKFHNFERVCHFFELE
jgi:hypothetical protein